MGSFPSPPLPQSRQAEYRVYAPFCSRTASPQGREYCNWIECYNPSTNTWRCMGPIPGIPERHILKGFAMVAVGNAIYIIGGRLCLKDAAASAFAGGSPVSERNVTILDTVLRYSVSSQEWAECAPLITPRFDFACAVRDGKIYVAGGQCALGTARGVQSAETYDPAADEWAPLPDMSTLRYKCVGVTWRGKMYVVGGFAERGGGVSDRRTVLQVERSSAEVFDVGRGEWDVMPGMWQLDVPPNQIVAIDSKLYSSGDCFNTWKGHIEFFDGKVSIWTAVEGSRKDSFLPSDAGDDAAERMYLTMVALGHQLFFLAGYRLYGGSEVADHDRSVSVVHAFDITARREEAWRTMATVEEEGEKELCSHCCVVQL